MEIVQRGLLRQSDQHWKIRQRLFIDTIHKLEMCFRSAQAFARPCAQLRAAEERRKPSGESNTVVIDINHHRDGIFGPVEHPRKITHRFHE